MFSAVDITEVPTKCISVLKTVRVMAQVQYIDFEGRSDGESLQKILGQLRPRRLILVRGTPESTYSLLNLCRQWSGTRVFAPSRGEVVDATTETHIYQVQSPTIVSSFMITNELKKFQN
jgi:cleavage and polyadenylation specificity factor subunit 2